MVAVPRHRPYGVWIRRREQFRGKYVVVKLGGSALEDRRAVRGVLADIAVLNRVGVRVVLVHGGGKRISRAMAERGIEPRFVFGRRYTDDETLSIASRVLAEDIAPELVAQLSNLGVDAAALSYATDSVLVGERLRLRADDGATIDLGHVGEVTRVDEDAIAAVVDAGCIPVIPSVALDDRGRKLNVNADSAAAAVARYLGAERLVFFSDVPGVCLDPAEPASLCSRLDSRRCRQLVADGCIGSGMIPKVDAAVDAVRAGVGRVHILDGRTPGALLDGLYCDAMAGTEITL